MSIKAVIYDVDGTLVDSEPLHVAAWNLALRYYGSSLSDLPEEFMRTMAGRKPIMIAIEMTKVLKLDVEPSGLLRVKTAKYVELAERQLRPMEGAVESIKSLRGAGYRLAIGTSLDAPLLDKILHRLNIEGNFEVKVTGDQIQKGKPDPETYLKVAELLELEPQECVVLEDAETGIRSAKAAGMTCVAVENAKAIKQDTKDADIVVTSALKVTPELVARL